MKIVIVHGSPRKGNTLKATEYFKEQMQTQGEIAFVDIHLPKDLPEFCCGCMTCFLKGEDKCPHALYTMPILEQLIAADALIFTTPVYALSVSGCMKSFLDHFAYIFVVHRARPEMFSQKAFIISSTVGAGTKTAMRTIKTSLKFWGVNRIYTYGFATHGDEWMDISRDRKEKIEKILRRKAVQFYDEVKSGKKRRPYVLTKFMFILSKMIIKKYNDDTNLDRKYWIEQSWFDGTVSPFK